MKVPSFCPSFPHHGQWVTPLKWWSASGWWILVRPKTFGDSGGMLGGRISTLLVGLEHSWHTAVHSTQSKSPWSHRFQSSVGQWIWSCSGKCLPCCRSLIVKVWAVFLVVILSCLLHQFGIPAEGFLATPWQGFMEECFLLPFWMGGSLGVTLEVVSDWDGGSTQLGKLCCHLDWGKGLVTTWAEEGGICGTGSCWRGIPQGNAQEGRHRSIS